MKNSIFLYTDCQSNIMGMDNNILSLAQTKTRSISSNSHIHSHNSILIDIAEVSCTDTARRSRGRRSGSGSRGKGKSSGGSKGGSSSSGGSSGGSGSRGGRSSGRSSSSAGSSGSRSSKSSSSSSSGGSSGGSKSTSTSSGPKSSPSGQASARATRSSTTTSKPSATLSGPVGYASTYSAMGMSPTSNGKTLSTTSTYTGPQRTKYDTTQAFKTSEGKDMYVKGVDPQSKEGQTISAILQRQRDIKKINQERAKYVKAIRDAKTSGEALAIQAQAREQNPNIMIKQTDLKADGTKTVLPAGDYSKPIKRLDYTQRDSITGEFRELPKSTVTGQPSGVTVTGSSEGSDWEFLGSKTNLVTDDVKQVQSYKITQTGILPSFDPIVHPDTTGDTRSGDASSVQKGYDLSEFMTDDQKAFDFMPDIPKEDSADARAYSGLVKGTSNTMAGIWNIGTMFQQYALGRDPVTLDYKGFYATPVTALETGVVEGAVGTIYQKGQFGLDTKAFSREVGEGIGQAGQIAQDRPVESITSTLVEGVPYVVGSGVKGSIKFLGGLGKSIFKGSDTASTTGKTTGSNFGFDIGSIGKVADNISPTQRKQILKYTHPDSPTGSTQAFVSAKKKLDYGKPNGELKNILKNINEGTDLIPNKTPTPKTSVPTPTIRHTSGLDNIEVFKSPKKSPSGDITLPSGKVKPIKTDLDFLQPKGKLKLPDSSLPVKKTPDGLPVKKTVDTGVPMKMPNFGVPKRPTTPDPTGPRGRPFGGIIPFGDLLGGGVGGSGIGKTSRVGRRAYTAWDVDTDRIRVSGDTYVTSASADVLDTKFGTGKKKKTFDFDIDTTFNI